VDFVKLLRQPLDGAGPLIKGIGSAKRTIEIVIFRFDQREIERALASAVNRGVSVHALIAHTNRQGEEGLRKLEMRMLAAGITVARTSDDLIRYHGKMMIVDRRELYVLGFNLTYLDIAHSRSFGIVTRQSKVVHEAVKLFEADAGRRAYEASMDTFVVSPVNARRVLTEFIQKTRKELLIYDPDASDRAMVRLLQEKASAGVDIRVIGNLSPKRSTLQVHKMPQMRLHTRTMIRDGRIAFVGSQSLRELELDARREVGLIVREPKVVRQLAATFQEDWNRVEREPAEDKVETAPAARVAKRVAKAVAKDLPPLAPVLDIAVREVVGQQSDQLDPKEVEDIVKDAVKQVVKEVVRDAVETAVEQDGHMRAR
jgi:cardiolipin synthase